MYGPVPNPSSLNESSPTEKGEEESSNEFESKKSSARTKEMKNAKKGIKMENFMIDSTEFVRVLE